ncbi:LVIVD repeat-containing protein [Nocardioides marmoraquaticus]
MASVALLGLTAGTAPVLASTSTEESRESAPVCTEKERKKLAKAGDNFLRACRPGEDFAQMDDRRASADKGEITKSRNMSLVANVPKQGAFSSFDSYNSDLAFKGNYVFAGNYNGFTVYDIKNPKKPKPITQYLCPGGQGDPAVYGDILVFAVDSSRSSSSCQNTPQSAEVKSSWEGLRVFDISNPRNPQYVAAVETKCGSHTQTLAPSRNGQELFVYVSSYGPQAAFPDCAPPHDRISVVKINVKNPRDAKVVNEPVLFADGGNPGNGYTSATSGCHDITAYPEKNIAAGACMGDGILMDITDRVNPTVIERVRDDENFAFWHSATFNNRGTKVIFTDELGGGGAATCNPTVGSKKGANAIYSVDNLNELSFKSYYKLPRVQSNTENCVAHNGSLIPVKGKDVMVQAWYQGGISVFDFTDATKPKELGFFDRGPLSEETLQLGGSWSAYYYNGYIYSNDIQKGLDVLKLKDKRTDSATKVKMKTFNPQTQPSYRG